MDCGQEDAILSLKTPYPQDANMRKRVGDVKKITGMKCVQYGMPEPRSARHHRQSTASPLILGRGGSYDLAAFPRERVFVPTLCVYARADLTAGKCLTAMGFKSRSLAGCYRRVQCRAKRNPGGALACTAAPRYIRGFSATAPFDGRQTALAGTNGLYLNVAVHHNASPKIIKIILAVNGAVQLWF